MILSELLGSRVHTPDGSDLGAVVDVRFRHAGREGRRAGDLELVALIVSPRSRSSFYGYERGTVRGPALIAAVIRRLHRGARIVPWECVARVDRDVVHLGVAPPMIPLDLRLPLHG